MVFRKSKQVVPEQAKYDLWADLPKHFHEQIERYVHKAVQIELQRQQEQDKATVGDIVQSILDHLNLEVKHVPSRLVLVKKENRDDE